jgi:hypothetical protein
MRFNRILSAALATAAVSFAISAAPALAQDMKARTVMITIENLTTGQPFSPSFVATRAASTAAIWEMGKPPSDHLAAVAEGGQVGGFSGDAAGRIGKDIGDAALAVHTLPGQTRYLTVRVDAAHPLIDAAWMLGNTNDGFSGFTGVDGYNLAGARTLELRGYDAGSEKNSEKKGFIGALGGGNNRDPENGVITFHPGIRGDADAPKAWSWDVTKPVAKVTFTALPAGSS